MQVTLKIKRFNPEKDKEAYWGEYKIEAEPTDRLLDALNHVKWYVDGTLTYRRSCAHGVCGSDAMQINGSNALACKVLLSSLGSTITIEPLRGYKVIKDLLVDMDAFLEKFRSVKPYLITKSPDSREGAPAIARAARKIRRHHQMHSLRRVHVRLPVVLGRQRLHWARGHRQRPSFPLRFPRRGRRGAHGSFEYGRRRVALPHDLQLRGSLPARNQRDPRHWRSEEGTVVSKGLTPEFAT